jgi:transcriptional regulator with XRE-family HTH domain
MKPSSSHNSNIPPRRRLPVTRKMPVNMLLVENRIRTFMEHSTRYAFMGEARLAKDCGVSDAAICRLLIGYSSPSFAMLCKLTAAFEKEFKKSIDPRELAAIDGKYPSPTVCEIVGCKGCTPQAAWNEDDTMKPGYSSPRLKGGA